MRALNLIVPAACLAAASSASAQTETMTGPEVGDRVRRDLGTLFQPGGSLEASYGDMTRARGNVRTRPYATMVTGVCRMDEVIVSYADRGGYGGAAANATGPFGVAAQAWFKVLRDVRGQESVNHGRPFEGECAALDGAETRGWFLAPDAYVAVGGHQALAAARAQVDARGGSIMGCRESRQARVDCRHTLGMAAEGLVQITQIIHCHAAPRRSCFQLGLTDDSSVTIRLRYDIRGEERIESIHIEGPAIMI